MMEKMMKNLSGRAVAPICIAGVTLICSCAPRTSTRNIEEGGSLKNDLLDSRYFVSALTTLHVGNPTNTMTILEHKLDTSVYRLWAAYDYASDDEKLQIDRVLEMVASYRGQYNPEYTGPDLIVGDAVAAVDLSAEEIEQYNLELELLQKTVGEALSPHVPSLE